MKRIRPCIITPFIKKIEESENNENVFKDKLLTLFKLKQQGIKILKEKYTRICKISKNLREIIGNKKM